MKLHRPVIAIVISALEAIFADSLSVNSDLRAQYTDRVLEKIFKSQRKLGARDRRIVAESTYEIVRYWRLVWSLIGRDYREPKREELWKLYHAWLLLRGFEVPNWPEFTSIDLKTFKTNLARAESQPVVRESFPDWLYELGSEEIGERWPDVAHQLNQVAPVVLRANTLKITRENLIGQLAQEDVHCVLAPGTVDGLILSERKNVFSTQCFRLGYFEVQDGASQQAAICLDARPGDRIADCCAGAGGKTLHIAAMMKNKGKIISLDVHGFKLEELRRRCTRAGVDIAETRLIESSKTMKRMGASFDRVLLDVPCTGLGVVRRNPDAKWKIRPEEIKRLLVLQAEILQDYSELCKPGGRLVYSTCSILPSENSSQVANFLSRNEKNWTLRGQTQYWPGDKGYDGFFTACLERAP